MSSSGEFEIDATDLEPKTIVFKFLRNEAAEYEIKFRTPDTRQVARGNGYCLRCLPQLKHRALPDMKAKLTFADAAVNLSGVVHNLNKRN